MGAKCKKCARPPTGRQRKSSSKASLLSRTHVPPHLLVHHAARVANKRGRSTPRPTCKLWLVHGVLCFTALRTSATVTIACPRASASTVDKPVGLYMCRDCVKHMLQSSRFQCRHCADGGIVLHHDISLSVARAQQVALWMAQGVHT
jgi:hypothetical protein